VDGFFIVDLYSSRSSFDRDKKKVSDPAVETYDNVPQDTASQNGFVSIITSKHLLTIDYLLARFFV